MKICIIGKYPPIQGGVSRQMYWLAFALASLGNQVYFVTNSNEVEPEYRMYISAEQASKLECSFDNGGFVKLYNTEEPWESQYIPYANPFVSKLCAIAFEVVKNSNCSFIYTSYLEPYSIAGALVSQLTGVPYAIQHAGSDIGRLAQIKTRQSIYLEVLRNADLVITSNSVVQYLLAVGVTLEKVFMGIPGYLPEEYFNPSILSLDIAKLLNEIKDTEFYFPSNYEKSFNPSKPTIGVYCKPGKYKGTSEIVEALGILKKRGHQFNFVILCGVHGKKIQRFQKEIENNNLTQETYILPYLPHWLVPQFIRSCTSVCFLENRFPILIHRPQIPREILSCGRCLILSQEILEQQFNKVDFIDKENFLLVPDPQDIVYLTKVLDSVICYPEEAIKIGLKGHSLYGNYGNPQGFKPLVDKIIDIAKQKKEVSMSLAEFQNALIKMYTNQIFRELLKEDFLESLKDYNLSAVELNTLSALVSMKPQLDRFTHSLYVKKFNFLWSQYSTISKFFSFLESEVFTFFVRKFDFKHREWIEDINYFADILNEFFLYLNKRSDIPECFQDAVKYDRTRKEALYLSVQNTAFDQINNPYIVKKNGQNEYSFVKPEYVIIRALSYNIPLLYQDNNQQEEINLASLEKDNYIFAFVPHPERWDISIYELSPTLQVLLEKAKQPFSIGSLIQEAAIFNKIDEVTEPFQQACIQAIQHLSDIGVLIESSINLQA